jgi:hypothetical protein
LGETLGDTKGDSGVGGLECALRVKRRKMFIYR